MRRKAVSVMMLTLLLTSMLTLALRIASVSALDYPAIYVDPPSIIDPTLTPGKNFTISIKTDYTGEDIYGYEFTLSYNASILHGVNVTNGNLIPDIDPLTVFIPGTFNNTSGELSLTMAFFFIIIPPVPITPGPGTLANVTFTVVGIGETNITLGPETKLVGYYDDGYGEPFDIIFGEVMPDNLGHGYFSNVPTQVCGVDIVHVGIWTQWGTLFPILSLGNEIYFTWHPQVKVTVENNGTIPINCTVNSYYSDNTTTNLIGTQNVTNLPAGENTTLTFNWDVYELPQEAVYTVKANVTCHCGASDEFVYGQVKIRLWGDVDGNGVVNILDLKMMKIRIAMVIPEELWFPFCDLDGNAVVNILDLKKIKLIFSGLL